MVKTIEAINWERFRDNLLWIGLTYGAEGVESGERCKADLRAFKQRWVRRWGNIRGFWKLEFQRRGVPHYHLLVVKPKGFDLLECHRMWNEVVGGDSEHLIRGCHVVEWEGDSPAGYVAGYGSAASKEYQHQVPEGWWSGRWWGVWGLKPEWQEIGISERQFYRVRRVMRGLTRSRLRASGKRLNRRKGFRWQGSWVRGDLTRLLRVIDLD